MSATTESVVSPIRQKSGELHIISGPMFSGKTTELISFGKRYKSIGKRVMTINHPINLRENDIRGSIRSRNDSRIEGCISTYALVSILDTPEYQEADVILIEEGQFFGDLVEFVKKAIDCDNKIVAVAGLDGDYKRNEFGHILKLIPLADSFKKLSAFCKECGDGTLAPFTMMLDNVPIDNEGGVVVGSEDKYEPLCRKHYIEKNNNGGN